MSALWDAVSANGFSNLLALLALGIAFRAQRTSRAMARDSRRSADAAERSATAAEESHQTSVVSAEAARQSALSPAESVRIQRADWIERRTARLRVQRYQLIPTTHQLNVEPDIKGLAFVLANIGGASAVDVGAAASLNGPFGLSEIEVGDLDSGKSVPIRLTLDGASKDGETHLTVKIEYQDLRQHTMLVHFVLLPQPAEHLSKGQLAGPILEAVSLDGEAHPAHEDLPSLPS